MANWCLSRGNYKTLEKIFREPDPPPLSWSEDIRPLFMELKTQLHGNPIPPNYPINCELYLKLDSGVEVEIYQGRLNGQIGSNVVRAKVRRVLVTAGVKPENAPKGWARFRQFFPPFRRCNQ